MDLKRLSELLKPTTNDSDSEDEDDLPQSGLSKLGPGDIGPSRNNDCNDDTPATKEISDDITIWNESEIPDCSMDDDSLDPRERPEFDTKYRQAVTPEDVYLQLGGKTTSTASCEDMVVSVQLPGEIQSDVNLTVTSERLDVRSPRYRLSLALPHPVEPDSSKAEWIGDNPMLIVTLRMHRDLDIINF